MHRMSLLLLFSFSIALQLQGCASMNAQMAFSRGEKARKKGDLQGAIREYRDAVRADPKKAQYQTALEETEREVASVHVDAARRAEAAGRFEQAVGHWDRALEILPDSAELKARRGLADIRTQQADPVVFYRAAAKLVAAIPDDPAAQATLRDAKRSALGYHLRLAKMYAEAGSWAQAYHEYGVAKEIEPTHRVFATGLYVRAQARYLEAQGDKALAEGDSLGAYQAYEQASRLSRSRGIVRKMRRAKRGAGSTLDQLQQAERYEQQKQWEDAAELYTLIAAKKSAPVDLQERAGRARAKSAALRSKRAEDYATRGFATKACAELTLALEHTDAPAVVTDLLRSAIDDLSRGFPAGAKEKTESAKTRAMHLPLVAAVESVMGTVARVEYDRARSQAKSAPAEALVGLRRLAPFADRLPGYQRTRKGLIKRAFGALLSRAEESAEAGRYAAATEELATALDIAKAPRALAQHLQAATGALEKRDYAGARERFSKAVETDGRSRLARLGLTIATAARLEQLHREAAEARVVEDSVRAAAAYRGILELDPNDASAAAGIAELKAELIEGALAAARDHDAAGRAGAAFIYYRRVLDVDPNHAEAQNAVAKLEPALSLGEEPDGYVVPTIRGNRLGEECRGVEERARDRMVLYLNRTPKLGAKFLGKEGTDDVDAKARLVPPVKVRSAVESCVPLQQSGQIVMTIQLMLGSRVLMQDRVTARFDPQTIPKDELEDGLGPDQVMNAMIGDAAKQVSSMLKKQATALRDWRMVEARARMQANDAEGVAQLYASLVTDRSLSDGERRTVEELERFLMNRFR